MKGDNNNNNNSNSNNNKDDAVQKSSTSCNSSVSEKRPGVEHSYHDYANTRPEDAVLLFPSSNLGSMRQHNPLACGIQQQGFAVKLHYMLADIEASRKSDIVSWQPHGRCFVVHDRKAFVDQVLPSYFLQSTFASFQRQLNLYGFKRISSSQDKGGYYHELFLRSKPELACYIQRIKRKGSGPRKPDSPDSEPNFYAMPYLPTQRSTATRTPFGSGCFQGQMMNPTHHHPHDPKPAAVQVLTLRAMLPAAMLGASTTISGPNYHGQPQVHVGNLPQPQPMYPPPPCAASKPVEEFDEDPTGKYQSQLTPIAPAPPTPYGNCYYVGQWDQPSSARPSPGSETGITQYQGGCMVRAPSSYGTDGVGAVPVAIHPRITNNSSYRVPMEDPMGMFNDVGTTRSNGVQEGVSSQVCNSGETPRFGRRGSYDHGSSGIGCDDHPWNSRGRIADQSRKSSTTTSHGSRRSLVDGSNGPAPFVWSNSNNDPSRDNVTPLVGSSGGVVAIDPDTRVNDASCHFPSHGSASRGQTINCTSGNNAPSLACCSSSPDRMSRSFGNQRNRSSTTPTVNRRTSLAATDSSGGSNRRNSSNPPGHVERDSIFESSPVAADGNQSKSSNVPSPVRVSAFGEASGGNPPPSRVNGSSSTRRALVISHDPYDICNGPHTRATCGVGAVSGGSGLVNVEGIHGTLSTPDPAVLRDSSDSVAMSSDQRSGSNGFGVPPPCARNGTTMGRVGYTGGRPMPPMPLVPSPAAFLNKTSGSIQSKLVAGEQLRSSPALTARKGLFVSLLEDDARPEDESCLPNSTTLSRSSSGSLSPASWRNAFGEEEDFWCKLG